MSEPAARQLLERDGELGELGAVFEGAAAGRGRLAVIEGAAGSGKSALTSAASERAAAAGLRVLHARGTEIEAEFGFGAVRQLFEPVLASASAEQRTRLLGGAAAPAEPAVTPTAAPTTDTAPPGFAALHAIYWLAANLAAETPALLVVDDAHWADASSLRALNYLTRRTADVPIALLVAMRPAEPGAPAHLLDELRAEPNAARIALGPLGSDSTARIVRERIPAAEPETCAAFHDASAGNPLYLQELLRTVVDEGLHHRSDPAAAVREASVPSLADRVTRRIAAVGSEAPQLSSAMAVLGDGGELTMAGAIAGVGRAEAGRIAHELRRIEVLASEDPFAFVHPLVRRSAYDAIPVGERGEAHAIAARLLREAGAPAESVAAHLGAVSPSGSSAAAATLLHAAEGALAKAAPDEALRWFRRALEEEAAEPPRAAILRGLGMTEGMLAHTAGVDHLREALELEPNPESRVRITVALGEVLFLSGRSADGMAAIAATRGELGDAHPELAAELAAIELVVKAYDPTCTEELEAERSGLAELTKGDGWSARALAAMLAAVAAQRGDPADQVTALADAALEDGVLLTDRPRGAWAVAHILIALISIDDYERALDASELAIAAARRYGAVAGLVTATAHRGWAHARHGDLAAAEADLRTALEAAPPGEAPPATATQLFYLQDALLERPSLDDMTELVDSLQLGEVLTASWPGAALTAARGRLRLARQDREGGIEDLRASHAVHVSLNMGPTVSPSGSALALALPASERQEALSLVERELELARATSLPRPEGVALRAHGILEGGELGIEHLRESVSLLAGSGARLEQARALVELGSALRRAQLRAEARPELAAGMELAHACGARRLVDRAREELHSAGGRPRRVARTGRDALTASELRVAKLAADRWTNPDIAQDLYVSPKTIETHLSNVYRKLGLSGQGSRGRLAEALRTSDQEGAALSAASNIRRMT